MMTPWLWRLPDDICAFLFPSPSCPHAYPICPLEVLSLLGTSVARVFVSALLVVDRHHSGSKAGYKILGSKWWCMWKYRIIVIALDLEAVSYVYVCIYAL